MTRPKQFMIKYNKYSNINYLWNWKRECLSVRKQNPRCRRYKERIHESRTELKG